VDGGGSSAVFDGYGGMVDTGDGGPPS